MRPTRTAALFFNPLTKKEMFKTEYNFDEWGKVIITSYPELKDYLIEKLRELGHVEYSVGNLGEPNYLVTLRFSEPPKIYDWRKEWPDCLYINSDAGGCFSRILNANCYELPKPDSLTCKFSFNLFLDSRYFPEAEHSEEKVKAGINNFVQQAMKGFCYHFKD